MSKPAEEPLLSEAKKAEINRLEGKIEKMEAKGLKLKDEPQERGRRPLVLKSLNMSDKPFPEISKTSKDKFSSSDKMNKTVLNLSDKHKTRVDNALALLSNSDRKKAIKNAYDLGKTVVHENGMTLGNLTQRVKKSKKKRAKGSKSPDPIAGSNSITVKQSSIEESVDKNASIMEGSIIENNADAKDDKSKERKTRKKSKKKRNQKH